MYPQPLRVQEAENLFSLSTLSFCHCSLIFFVYHATLHSVLFYTYINTNSPAVQTGSGSESESVASSILVVNATLILYKLVELVPISVYRFSEMSKF